jgi:hypothetical protein
MPNESTERPSFGAVIPLYARTLEESARVDEQMKVFSRPRQASDELALGTSKQVAVFVDRHRDRWPSIGTAEADRARLLVRGGGLSKAGLFGVPTTGGWVCATIPFVASHCARALREGITWAIYIAERRPGKTDVLIYGLASDDVSRVAATIDGKQTEAALGEGGFTAEAESSEGGSVTEIAVGYRNGTVTTISVEWRLSRRSRAAASSAAIVLHHKVVSDRNSPHKLWRVCRRLMEVREPALELERPLASAGEPLQVLPDDDLAVDRQDFVPMCRRLTLDLEQDLLASSARS